MFGKENIMNRGMVIYAEEDKVIRNSNSPPPNLGVSDKIPLVKASVENESAPIACCIIKETKPFDMYNLH